MLPIFTTEQVKDGIDSTDMMIDLSDYMKKKDGATKTELQSLTAVVAGKLDATPQHKHDISDVKDLREELESKYDRSQKYSYNVILSDADKIPYLEAPRVGLLDISANREIDGYRFYVDDMSGDLMITLNDLLIASYSIAAGKWNFNGATDQDPVDLTPLNTRIDELSATVDVNHTSIEAQLLAYQTKTDAVLKNHYDALLALCEKHGMIDSNESDGSKITPST